MGKWKFKFLIKLIIILETINFIVMLLLPKNEMVSIGIKGTFSIRLLIYRSNIIRFYYKNCCKKIKRNRYSIKLL